MLEAREAAAAVGNAKATIATEFASEQNHKQAGAQLWQLGSKVKIQVVPDLLQMSVANCAKCKLSWYPSLMKCIDEVLNQVLLCWLPFKRMFNVQLCNTSVVFIAVERG